MSTNLNDLKLISKERILHELDLALSYDYTGEFFYILQITNNLINFFPYLNQYMLKNPNILIQLNNKRLSKMEKYLLLINDNNSIYELALDKKLLNWMHHYLIVNQLLATNRWCSQEVLKICKQLNALRNPQPILLLLKSLKSIKPDFENNIILLDKILRLCICSKPIIPPIASKTEIIQIVNDHYLNLITQIRNSHVN
jgi:tRNA nucleotidyltransferase/poly(A) polymerase